MSTSSSIDRRTFLKVSATAGAGLVIAITLPGCNQEPGGPPEPTTTLEHEPGHTELVEATFEPSIYLSIDHTGAVTVTAFRSEMGQGIRTAIAMILAEELDADWSAVKIEQAPADTAYGDQVTGGSVSISNHYSLLRKAGAKARQVLVDVAAQRWAVNPESCTTDKGVVSHPGTGQKLSYGQLAAMAAEMEILMGMNDLKAPEDFDLIGTGVGHYDNPQFVNGSAVYGMDIQLPGMLFATVTQCPVFGGKLVDFEASGARAVPGVRQVLEISSGVAVIAENTWAAFQGRRELQITWDEGRGADTDSEGILETMVENVQDRIGSFEDDTVYAAYINPYLAHATMEPMNCTADLRADRCEVWAPTQNPRAAKQQVIGITGLKDDAVIVHIPLIGGGFGRRLEVDYVRQAVEISQAIKAPVKVVWSREDDVQHDYYHPLGFHLVNAKKSDPRLPKAGTQLGRNSVPTGAWRSVNNFHEALARECFLDELALELGKDPFELRLELYPQSLRAVLELAAEKSDWDAPTPDGWGKGMACYSTFGATPVAHITEVSVDDEGNVRVHRVVCAVECGTVVNPDGVRAQMEGGVAFGLTAALKAGITIEGGRVVESNFHDYPLLSMDEMPVVETHFLPVGGSPSGIGEMGVPPTAPAVLNAIYDATGVRVRRIPVRRQDLIG